jgi:hypothetical protein
MIYVLLMALLAYAVMFTWVVLKAKKESNK